MTNTEKILRMLADGRPRSLAQIAAEADLSNEAARDAVRLLRGNRYAIAQPVTYGIQPKGAQRVKALVETEASREAHRLWMQQHHKPKMTDAERLARSRQRKQVKKEARPEPVRGQRMEYFARLMNPNSVFDLGRVLTQEVSHA